MLWYCCRIRVLHWQASFRLLTFQQACKGVGQIAGAASWSACIVFKVASLQVKNVLRVPALWLRKDTLAAKLSAFALQVVLGPTVDMQIQGSLLQLRGITPGVTPLKDNEGNLLVLNGQYFKS